MAKPKLATIFIIRVEIDPRKWLRSKDVSASATQIRAWTPSRAPIEALAGKTRGFSRERATGGQIKDVFWGGVGRSTPHQRGERLGGWRISQAPDWARLTAESRPLECTGLPGTSRRDALLAAGSEDSTGEAPERRVRAWPGKGAREEAWLIGLRRSRETGASRAGSRPRRWRPVRSLSVLSRWLHIS